VSLPFRALSLSRYRLDDALLKAAQNCGAQLLRNASVQVVAPTVSGWKVRCGDGETLHCRNLVLATGKWGVRGLIDTRDTSLVGLKIHLRVTPQIRHYLAGRVELGLMDCGYIGLELVEDETANLCFLLPRSVVAHVGTSWLAMQNHLTKVLPPIAQRFVGAEPLWDKAIAVVCPIGGHLHAQDNARLYRVGDRLAHIPPFTGDGIGIALASAALAVEHICRGLPTNKYLASARGLTSNAIRLATLLSEIAASDMGRTLLIGAARHVPALIGSVARRTRLTPTAQAHGPSVTG
jgi:flavin-dependent dehydrogenase